MVRVICDAKNCTANGNGECAIDSITIDKDGFCEDFAGEEE
ncbi:hypothetical protein ES708_19502 [subsurface metagenome]